MTDNFVLEKNEKKHKKETGTFSKFIFPTKSGDYNNRATFLNHLLKPELSTAGC